MAQFIYQQTGRMRHAAVLTKCISFNLTGCTGTVYWTNKSRPTAYSNFAEQQAFADSFMPLDGQRGFITGATALQVRIENLDGQFAVLETLAVSDPEQEVTGQLTAMCSMTHAIARDMRVVAGLI